MGAGWGGHLSLGQHGHDSLNHIDEMNWPVAGASPWEAAAAPDTSSMVVSCVTLWGQGLISHADPHS